MAVDPIAKAGHTLRNPKFFSDNAGLDEEARSAILDQYKLYVELTDRISQRRQAANAFFLSINTAVIAAAGYVSLSQKLDVPHSYFALIAAAGLVLNYIWFRMVKSYQGINTAKFRMIHAIEQELPLRPYDAEWIAVGEGHDPSRYLPFTNLELRVPWIFIAVHGVVLLRSIPWQQLSQLFR
jgi:hypothetical protein